MTSTDCRIHCLVDDDGQVDVQDGAVFHSDAATHSVLDVAGRDACRFDAWMR